MNQKIDWSAPGSLESKLFKLSFPKMLDFVKATNDLEEHILEKLSEEKPEGWQVELDRVLARMDNRLRFVDFRISFELGHDMPLVGGGFEPHIEVAKDLHRKGAITDERLAAVVRGEPSEDLEAVQKCVEEMRREHLPEDPGVLLWQLALADVFLHSQTERAGDSLKYFQDGKLRAVTGVNGDVPHGSFEVFYPTGQTWMVGQYENGKMMPASMRIFMPDGSEAKPTKGSPSFLN